MLMPIYAQARIHIQTHTHALRHRYTQHTEHSKNPPAATNKWNKLREAKSILFNTGIPKEAFPSGIWRFIGC